MFSGYSSDFCSSLLLQLAEFVVNFLHLPEFTLQIIVSVFLHQNIYNCSEFFLFFVSTVLLINSINLGWTTSLALKALKKKTLCNIRTVVQANFVLGKTLFCTTGLFYVGDLYFFVFWSVEMLQIIRLAPRINRVILVACLERAEILQSGIDQDQTMVGSVNYNF